MSNEEFCKNQERNPPIIPVEGASDICASSCHVDDISEETPEFLYHATLERNVPSILNLGILSLKRKFVHLWEDPYKALDIAQRHVISSDDKVVLFSIRLEQMKHDGVECKKYIGDHGHWIVKHVPSKFVFVVAG